MGMPYYATLPREDVGRQITARVQRYFANTRVGEILAKQRIAYRYYYDLGLNWAGWGTPGTTNMMQRGGEEGELALVRINHARSLVRNQIAMISNAKFDRRPRASSDDYDAMRATEQCRYALEHYTQSGGLEQLRIERIESASTMGEGFTYYGWNPARGKQYAADPGTGLPVYTGDVEAQALLPWDVIRNPYRLWKQQLDVTIRFPNVNRWILAGMFPEFEDEILRSPAQTIVPFFVPVANAYDGPTPDDTELFRYFHLPSPIKGLERGRQVTVLGSGIVLEDKPLDINRFPLVRVAEAGVMGSPFGYASFWEYLGIQELYDNLQSVVATNQSTFGAQTIAVKSGVDPRPIQIGGGMSVFVCNDPERDLIPKQLTKSPAEVFPHMQDLRRNMELLSGVSQVDRGEAQGDRQSGSALALLSAQSIRNASPYQTSDVEALKEEGQILIRLLRAHANRPIAIGISERGQTAYEKAITGHDLGDVDSVDIELANPLQQTTEGRVAILQTFAQLKIPLQPEQAMEVVTSGRLEPVTDGVTHEGLRIRLENKMIASGQTPRALITDDAIRHCREHTVTMSDTGRDDPAVQQAFIAHVEDHYRVFYGADPEQDKQSGLYRPRLMSLCGLQPPPPGPEEQMGPPGPGGAPEGAPPPPGAGPLPPPPPGKEVPLPPPGPAAGPNAALGPQAGLPSLPRNAGTGSKWTPVTGGGTPV
jgi:hypothetical protein